MARPVSDLERSTAMYAMGLGWEVLASFEDHEGFSGVMLGLKGSGHHVEFTLCKAHPVRPTPSPEDLWVFYIPAQAEWAASCGQMLAAGFKRVPALNPYWDHRGATFEDHDGYRVVLQAAAWDEA